MKGDKMGQYHILANLDKREVVVPHALGLGLKQREHLAQPGYPLSGSLSDALYILTMTSPGRGGGDLPDVMVAGRWAGDRCVVLGDYTDDSDLPGVPNAARLFDEALAEGTDWQDISALVASDMGDIYGFQVTGDGWKVRTSA